MTSILPRSVLPCIMCGRVPLSILAHEELTLSTQQLRIASLMIRADNPGIGTMP